MTVKFRPLMEFSTCSLALARGPDMAAVVLNETYRNRFTLASFAALDRFILPAASTDSIESPGCRLKVDVAVEIIPSTPRQAAAIESASFRSPKHSSVPHKR